jgi:three-Cys-motif partner protein
VKNPSIGALVGPWAKIKLEALQRYLDFYTKVLKNQRWRTIYVDGYAGGGRSVIRAADRHDWASLLEEDQIDADQLELISGSPRVALDIANPFTRYIFVEPDRVRAAELETLRAEYAGSRQIDVRIQDAVAGVQWVLSQNIDHKRHRGVAFLDPFGARLDWSTIQALADTKLFEVVITFALNMAIQRMLPNSGVFQVGWRERLDAYFGTPAWYDEVYKEQTGLLGAFVEKRADYLDRLLSLYRDRLRTAFGFVSQPMLIRNTKGTPLYYLLWAGPHRKGLQGADYILGMGERLGRNLRRERKE